MAKISNSLCRNMLVLGTMLSIMALGMDGNQNSLVAATRGSDAKPAQQNSWKPNGPLTVIVGAGAGTAYDWFARQLATMMRDYLGKPVIVNISPGGGGAVALDMLHKSRPDGRTFALYGLGTQIALEFEKRYHWDIKDFNVVLAVDVPPYVVLSSQKHSRYKDFNALMKSKEEVRIATPGPNFAIVPLIMQLEKNGIKYRAARFKGAAEANLAVIAGDADLTISALSSVALDPIRAGDFQALWVFANKRYPDLPNVPTHIELGMPREWANYNLARLIVLPPGTPVNIQNAFTEALKKCLQDKRTLEWSKKIEVPVDILERKEMEERIRVVTEGFKNNLDIVKRYFL